MNLKDKILKYASFTLVFLAPLVYWSHRLYPHISSKTFFIYGVVEIMFFVWVYAVIIDSSYRISKKALLCSIPMVLFMLWMTIAGIFGANFSTSLWSSLARGTGLLTLYHCLALAIVTISLVQKYGSSYIKSIFKWFISGAVLGVISIWMGPGGLGINTLVLTAGGEGGIIGNSSLAAVYMTFAIAFSVFLILSKESNLKTKRLLFIAICIIIFSPLFINISGIFNGHGIIGTARASLLALPVFLASFGVLYLILSQKKLLRGLGITGIIIGVLGFSYFWAQLITPDTYLHNTFAQEARGSRFIFWDIASKSIEAHPLLGYGPENYFIAFQENFNPDSLLSENSMEGFSDKAHNIYFDLGVSGGYPAIILYILFLISLLYAIYKAKYSGKITRAQSAILGSLILGYVFQNLFVFDSNLSLMAIFVLAGVLFALQSNPIDQKINKMKIKDSYLLMIFTLILFFTSWTFFTYMPAKKSKLYAETFASSIDKRPEMYNSLLNGSSVGEGWDVSGLAFDTYRMYSSSAVSIKNDKTNLQAHIKNLEALISYLYKIAEINKTDYRLYISIANLENTLTYLSSRPPTVEDKNRLLNVLEKAKILSPTNPNVYWVIAQVKVWSGDFVGTEEAYRKVMSVAPRLPGSYSLFLKYAEALNNKKLFDEIMIKAKENIKGFTYK